MTHKCLIKINFTKRNVVIDHINHKLISVEGV